MTQKKNNFQILFNLPNLILSTSSIFGFMIFVCWNAYADPIVDKKIEEAQKPIKKEMSDLKDNMIEINRKADKTLLIIERMAPKEIVQQVEREMDLMGLHGKNKSK